jgi:hypothetical protein
MYINDADEGQLSLVFHLAFLNKTTTHLHHVSTDHIKAYETPSDIHSGQDGPCLVHRAPL